MSKASNTKPGNVTEVETDKFRISIPTYILVSVSIALISFIIYIAVSERQWGWSPLGFEPRLGSSALLYSGTIDKDGNVTSGEGFKSRRINSGEYDVTFDRKVDGKYIVLVTQKKVSTRRTSLIRV